jgi:hypothetical protein
MDGIYLYNKYGKPVTWEQWVSVREILGKNKAAAIHALANMMTDYVLTVYKRTSHSFSASIHTDIS